MHAVVLAAAFLVLSPTLKSYVPPLSAAESVTDESADETGADVNDSQTTPKDTPVFDENWSMDVAPQEQGSAAARKLTWRVSAAFKNLINARRSREFQDAWEKDEIAVRLECKYGTTERYLNAITDAFFYPTFISDTVGDEYIYSDKTRIARNGTISSRKGELVFRELYYNYTVGKSRYRLGNQIYAWGTADFMNSTAYINPQDLRELIFKEQNQIKMGVPSVSGMFFFNRFTMELVWIPIHTAARLPETGNFWAAKTVEGHYPLYFGEPAPMDANSENFGYAARLATSFSGIDMSISGYHGPDREPVLLPYQTVITPGEPLGVMVRPEYHRVDFIGGDFSMSRGDLVVQAEAAYSPDKSGFIKQDTQYADRIIFPFSTKRSGYYSYSAGFNYFIPMHRFIRGHTGDALFTLEWYQARYTDGNINSPLLTDLLTCRYQDDFFDKRLHFSVTSVFETRRGGLIFWPAVEWDLQNGFKIEFAYAAITGQGRGEWENDSVFYYFRNNDFIMVNLRYAYP